MDQKLKQNDQIKRSGFCRFCLSDEILEALYLLDYKEPTRIQQEVIPVLLAGQNAVVKAPTGSGKTAAFVIPACQKICWEENIPQVLVLEPTRELSVQVQQEAVQIGRRKRIKAAALFGGFPIDKQIRTLCQKTHLVIGTPGRVLDHIGRGSLDLSGIRLVIIDEADLMLDMGFIDELKEILDCLPGQVRISLFSATLEPEISRLIEASIEAPVTIFQENEGEDKARIVQKLYQTGHDQKYEALKRILIHENPESCIIFCGTKEMTAVLFQKLRKNRIFCGMLHGDMDQKDRLKTIGAFRRGGFRFLIATDVAARGIDFDDISLVVNYDFPTGRESYVHRIGRTGRNGCVGTAVSLVGEADLQMLEKVEAYTGASLALRELPAAGTKEEEDFFRKQRVRGTAKEPRGAALSKDILRLSIGGGRKSKIRTGDIVGTICAIEGIAAEDIGVIDIRESISYVEILNGKGHLVMDGLAARTLKGRIRKVRITKNNY